MYDSESNVDPTKGTEYDSKSILNSILIGIPITLLSILIIENIIFKSI